MTYTESAKPPQHCRHCLLQSATCTSMDGVPIYRCCIRKQQTALIHQQWTSPSLDRTRRKARRKSSCLSWIQVLLLLLPCWTLSALVAQLQACRHSCRCKGYDSKCCNLLTYTRQEEQDDKSEEEDEYTADDDVDDEDMVI